MTKAKKPRKTVDWDAIEPAYRAGIKSLRQIAKDNGITDGAIIKHAKLNGWTRDLSAAVRNRAKDMVSTPGKHPPRARTAADEEAVIESEAKVVAGVIETHRHDIKKGRDIVLSLLSELTKENESIDEIEDAIIEETAADMSKKRRYEMLKAVSLPSRAGVVRDLSQALSKLIPLERQAFNLENAEGKDDLATALLGLKHVA